MSTNTQTFRNYLDTELEKGAFPTDDLIAAVLPLFQEVLHLHEAGLVAPFDKEIALIATEGKPDIDESFAHKPLNASGRIQDLLDKARSRNFEIVGREKLETSVNDGVEESVNREVQFVPPDKFELPAYIGGYRCYELLLGHHDDQTDIFCLGLIMASLGMNLNLFEEEDLKEFAEHRKSPQRYNTKLHPSICNLITEMTELDRAKRSQDLYEVISRMLHYRDFDPEKLQDLSEQPGHKTRSPKDHAHYVFGKLRNRLFDTSRRNRLLYYKPNARFVNLTVSSVPTVLQIQSIRQEHIFTWTPELESRIRGLKDILLNKYLRFDEHTYLPPALDKIRSEAQRDVQEFGFSQLKLVIAFLGWNNLKEDVQERIQSPLLFVPVTLKKNKRVKEDHYILEIHSNEAEVNPILASELRELFGIKMPDFIDLDDTTVLAFYENLKEQIEGVKQGISLQLIDKPRIKLIQSVAQQTALNYQRRLNRQRPGQNYFNLPYNYDPREFQPLGLEIYKQFIASNASVIEYLVNDDVKLSGNNLTGTNTRELYSIAEGENNPYAWEFDICNLVLGNFNYKKMSLVRDYNRVLDGGVDHPVVSELFGSSPRRYEDQNPDISDASSWFHVIAADPTQTRAVIQARKGKSYIIQGPPGTGKSQTITNLIADFLGHGKKVLFVCEKRAALDVVYHRLKQQGLEELCCYIHDSQSDKREFVRNLKETYEGFIADQVDVEKVEADREALVHRLKMLTNSLIQYHKVGQWVSSDAGIEVHALIERLVALKSEMPAKGEFPGYANWLVFGEAIQQLHQILEEEGFASSYAEHPFSHLKEEVFQAEVPSREIRSILDASGPVLDKWQAILHQFDIGREYWRNIRGFAELLDDAVFLAPLAESNTIRLVDTSNAEARKYDKMYAAVQKAAKNVSKIQEANVSWINKLSQADAENAAQIAEANEGKFFNFFSGDYRRIKKILNESYNFGAHAVRPKYAQILQQLLQEYGELKKLEESRDQLQTAYRFENPETAQLSIERMRKRLGDPEIDYLVTHPNANELVKQLYAFNHEFRLFAQAMSRLLVAHETQPLEELRDKLETINANLDQVQDLTVPLRKLATAPIELKRSLKTMSLKPVEWEAGMARHSLDEVLSAQRAYDGLDDANIEQIVSEIHSGYRELLQLNAQLIRVRIRKTFQEHVDLSNMAISQLNAEQRTFKKDYAEGRKILENEFGKSMRYKSIRDLAGRESGLVLRDIKPVWLMSPLSVSDTLPIDASYFDVVIFDEASQITLEEGVPAVFRAPQSIIVGDDKQMPPSNFFAARAEDPDDLSAPGSEDDQEMLSNDADSLLTQGVRKMNHVMLGWHYRSRHETLISYSNHAFYEAGLLTIPDKIIHHDSKPEIKALPEQGGEGLQYLFDRSISFHHLQNSPYESRSNIGEANYIALMVREALRKNVKESIGIVAFSQEQQHVIEDALTNLASEDPEFERLLEEAYTRTEHDQYVGLIIKNLENIQGDERDIIIMSICYGPDARGKMLMNFGPINKKGGEKRLNVIFSRAKKHMAVVSSIQHFQITNEYNEGANYFRRFLQYAELVSNGNMAMARTILDGLVMKKGKLTVQPKSNVQDEIYDALSKRGLVVEKNIGQSAFRASLAIRLRPEDKHYALSLLIDDGDHYRNVNVVEQYYQRPALLRDFGWKCLQIFSKDWLQNPDRVLDKILKRLHGDVTEEAEVKRVDYIRPRAATGAGLYDDLKYREFHCTEGGSSKFWKVAQNDKKLIVRYGKIGTRGQTQVKSFDTNEKAAIEMDKMIREKLGKDYTEIESN